MIADVVTVMTKELKEFLLRGGAEVEEVRKDSASLEEVFLTLMEEK